VDDELQVRLLTHHRRDDAELLGSVLKALSWNALVPDDIDATVENGVVTLNGTVESRAQRDEAESTIRNLKGVAEIRNEIEVRSVAMAADVAERVGGAFRRSAQIDAEGIRVEVVDGTVTLSGSVTSWAEHDAALDAAWAAPGVQNVKDKLEVGYW
jgi:osmotically-inducible protein OsmY